MSQPAPDAPKSFADAQDVLAATLPNYERRSEQQALAAAIEQSWADESILVGQAGTGTGKSLAALIPAILSGERTVYSTATKALQSQIVGKDLPFLAEHLGVPFRYAMLQGRSNYFCLGGETLVVTRDGVRPIAEMAGTTKVIVDGNGRWTDARIESFGYQSLTKISLRCGRETMEVRATPEHRWFKRPQVSSGLQECTTSDLRVGDKLAYGAPRPVTLGRMVPSPFGVAHGFVWGDGTKWNSRFSSTATVTLHGAKDSVMERFFVGNKMVRRHREGYSEAEVQVFGLPAFMKSLVDIDEAPSYLYGWLAGYFAADGSVSSDGVVSMHSADRKSLEHFETVALRLGIRTYPIRCYSRQGYGDGPSDMYRLTIDPDTVGSDFFLMPHHGDRVAARRSRKVVSSALRWTVEAIEETGCVEEVFCAVVPTTHSFVLGGGLLTGNCHLQATQEASSNPLVAEVLGRFNADDDDQGPAWPRLNGLREDTPVLVDNKSWSSMTITADECPRKKCPFYSVCRFQEAKAKADQAHVVVANHMLVALDGVVREQSDGYANVLGDYSHIIIDECHELAEYITMALSTQQTMGTWRAYGTELRTIFRSGEFEVSDRDAAEAYANDAIVAASTFFDTFEEGRVRHGHAVTNAGVVTPLIDILGSVTEILSGYDEIEDKGVRARINRLASRTAGLHKSLVAFLLSPDSETVRVFEKSFGSGQPSKVLRVIPVRVGDWAKQWLWEACTPTMISATVLIDGRPDFIVDQLGLDCAPVVTIDVGSPFDFNRQSRLYVPAHICEPTPARRVQWEFEMMPLIEEMVKISEGRALLLFTSNKQMQTAWDTFASRIPYPCRKQGDASTALLTTWFREETHSVLFATRSFFTGIDIQGESLSLVVIDKLPFPVPNDPVFEARCEDVERRGKNSFADLTIPMMTLVLQQAFGRLIRTKMDRGVVAIMDPRLKTKGYGGKIRRSLPAPYTDDLNEVERFFSE